MKKLSKFILIIFLCLGISTKCYSYNFINSKKKANIDTLYISLNELSKALNTTIKPLNDNKIITIKGNEIEFSLGGITKINGTYCSSSSYKLNSNKGIGILVPKYDEFIVEKDDWFIPLNFLEEKLKLDVEMIDDKVSIKSCDIDELKVTPKSEIIDDSKTESKDIQKNETQSSKTSDNNNSSTQSNSNEAKSGSSNNSSSKSKPSKSNSNGTYYNKSTHNNSTTDSTYNNTDDSTNTINDNNNSSANEDSTKPATPSKPSEPQSPSEPSNPVTSETQESSGGENIDN